MKHTKLAVGFIVVAIALILGHLPAGAQEPQANFQWDGVRVKDALAALSRQFQLNFVLPDELGERKITASLVNASPDKAFRTILDAANLTAVDDGGVWRVRDKPEPGASRRAAPQPFGAGPQPVWGAPQPAGGRQFPMGQPPSPFRQMPPQVQRGIGAEAGAAEAGEIPEEWDTKNWVMRVIPIKFVNPYLLGEIFGGYAVTEESYRGGGGGGYGGQSGGYGGG